MTGEPSPTSAQDATVPAAPAYQRGPHWMAVVAAAFTLPLLFVGGSVTTYGVGMAVPDWPTTFGMNMFLYNFWNAPFGVQVEHTHRLYGAAVGLATLILFGWFLAREPRRWLRILGGAALLTVIVQGVLGGTRVTRISTTLAAFHGGLAQAFFAMMVALAVMTGRDWLSAAPRTADSRRVRLLASITLAVIYAQIALGAWVRHFSGLKMALIHGVGALVVLGLAVALVVRVRGNAPPKPSLASAAWVLLVLSILQIALGLGSFLALLPFDGIPRAVSFYQAVTRTTHQTNGAVLLAASLVLTLRAFRHLGPVSLAESSPSTSPSTSPLSSATPDRTNLEVAS